MKKYFLLLILISGISLQVYGQLTVRGTVTDARDGTTLPGVTIQVSESAHGTITDMNGNYQIEVDEDAVLIFSFIGMQTREIAVEGREQINVALEPAIETLEEVVLIGYGTGNRQDLTAPITTVKSEEISGQSTANPAQALQGKVSGMQVTNTGEPGSSPQIRIRGVSTVFSEGGGPLYVVDGVIVNDINFLNNNDIETITVLKDASAGAIYGVQAANGVILITTKEGETGPPVVEFTSYTGFQQATNILEMANTDQYIQLLNQKAGLTGIGGFFEPENYPQNTDWYSQLTRTALITNHDISVSGGSENSSYSYGIGYIYQDGILDSHNSDSDNNFNRINFRAKSDYLLGDVTLGYNLVFSQSNTTPAYNQALFQSYVAPPAFEARTGTQDWTDPTALGFSGPFANPVASAFYFNEENKEYTIIPALNLEVDFWEYFNFRSSLSARLAFGQDRNFTPRFFVSGIQNNNITYLNKERNFSRNLQMDNILEYYQLINNHSLRIMGGMSVQEFFSDFLTGTGYNVPDLFPETQYIILGDDTNRNATDGGSKTRVLSFFSRVGYNYDSRYLLTATIRADGSSKYNDPWGYFPSLGLGWVVSEEDFFPDSRFFEYLKIRGSWGQLGNNNVPANSAIIVGSPGPGSTGIFGGDNPVPGLTFQTVYNNFLVWETLEEIDAGLEIFSFENRLSLEVDFYNRITNNVVFYAPIPGVAGTTTLLGNNGKIRNRGVDLAFSWSESDEETDFSYSLSGNISFVDNEVLEIRNESGVIFGALTNGQFLTRTIVGQPIGAFYGYNVIGVFQSISEVNNYTGPDGSILQPDALPGDLIFENVNNDNRIDEEDRVMLGSPIPDILFGFTTNFQFRQWDASIVIQGVAGNKIYNAKRAIRNVFPDANYDLDFYENHWTGSGSTDTYPSAALTRRNIFPNSFFVESGSYVRIRSIQLGYRLPDNLLDNLNIRNARVYLSAQNPVTIFGYTGYTPEIGGSPIETGIDYDTYPLSATFTAGVNILF